MTRYAAIDIGSNSVRLLTCRYRDGQLSERNKMVEMTRLGKAVDASNYLQESRIIATLDVLKKYRQTIERLAISDCPVFATSAVRDADNSADFIARVKATCDFDIEIISGEVEAKYGFLGVVQGSAIDCSHFVIIDVGGGSTEIIYGDHRGEIICAVSLDVGAVRLTDRFQLAHPTTAQQVRRVCQTVRDHVRRAAIAKIVTAPFMAVGIGGTATTIAAIQEQLKTYDATRIQDYQMSSTSVDQVVALLQQSSRSEKMQIVGLNPKRVDIIAAGALIFQTVLDELSADVVAFSDYDNLEGALLDRITAKNL